MWRLMLSSSSDSSELCVCVSHVITHLTMTDPVVTPICLSPYISCVELNSCFAVIEYCGEIYEGQTLNGFFSN